LSLIPALRVGGDGKIFLLLFTNSFKSIKSENYKAITIWEAIQEEAMNQTTKPIQKLRKK
jgi:hypothetical protein